MPPAQHTVQGKFVCLLEQCSIICPFIISSSRARVIVSLQRKKWSLQFSPFFSNQIGIQSFLLALQRLSLTSSYFQSDFSLFKQREMQLQPLHPTLHLFFLWASAGSLLVRIFLSKCGTPCAPHHMDHMSIWSVSTREANSLPEEWTNAIKPTCLEVVKQVGVGYAQVI